MALRDVVLIVRLNGFFNLVIEGDSKVIRDCYNKKNNLPSSIIFVMKDIYRLTHDLNILNCCHIYKKANKTVNCLAKKDIYNTNLVI